MTLKKPFHDKISRQQQAFLTSKVSQDIKKGCCCQEIFWLQGCL